VAPLSEAVPILKVSGLSKAYRQGLLSKPGPPALKGLSFEVAQGEVFGFLGPNGAGKTTTIKILMGLVSADAGEASILGRPLRDRAWRAAVGFLPEQPYFYDYLTAAEYLDYVGRLFDLPGRVRTERTRQLLERVGLEDAADLAVRRYSKGMAQRLGLAQALINDPALLVLDEPMSGLDPIGRHMVRDLILALRKEGKTVFFSTHILSDAETLCDRVALLRAGELVKAGHIDEILIPDFAQLEVLLSGGRAGAIEAIREGVRGCQALGERWRLEVVEASLNAVLSAATAAGARVLSVQPLRDSLEDFFMREMGGAAARGEAEP
jgi:ABC-2 type transport system ATP-binding protein